MRRASFQFYPDTWLSNSKLRHASYADRGLWMDVLCHLHDQDEYGVVRCSLDDLAKAIGCHVNQLRGLTSRRILKGAPVGEVSEAVMYMDKKGQSLVVFAPQSGPVWFSSRLLVDEFKRVRARENGSKGGNPSLKGKTRVNQSSPKVNHKDNHHGYPSSSSSSSTSSYDDDRVRDPAAAVFLDREGIPPDDPIRRHANCTAAQAEIAVRNADYREKKGKLDDRRGFIVTAIVEKYGLASGAVKAEKKLEKAKESAKTAEVRREDSDASDQRAKDEKAEIDAAIDGLDDKILQEHKSAILLEVGDFLANKDPRKNPVLKAKIYERIVAGVTHGSRS